MAALPLLLLAALTATPPATVNFGQSGKLEVTPPQAHGANPPYQLEKTVMSPTGNAAALKYCLNVSMIGPQRCEIMLVKPNHPSLQLKNGVVGRLLWTLDGQYLIGEGSNTLRIWNLNGGGRQVTPTTGVTHEGLQAVPRISKTWLYGSDLCILIHEDWYAPDGTGKIRNTSDTVIRYALPSLRWRFIRTTSEPAPTNVTCRRA